MVTNEESLSVLGRESRKMRSLGMPTLDAASRAVSSKGMHVKRAFAPDVRSWCSSSEAEYAALAGVTMPEMRWTAWQKGM